MSVNDGQLGAEAAAIEAYNSKMEEMELPTDDPDDLAEAHVIFLQYALHAYFQTLLANDEAQVQEHQKKVQEVLKERLAFYQSENRRLSVEACRKKLAELHLVIDANVKRGKYKRAGGRESYDDDVNELKEAYQSADGLGEMKEEMLAEVFHLNRQTDTKQVVEENESPKTEIDAVRGIMDELRSLFEQFQEKPAIWQNTRMDNISWLRQQAFDLEKHKKNVNIATVAGTGIGMAGTISGITIISVALAPITFGGSLALGLGLGAAAVSIGGAATAIGAQQIKKRKINKDAEEEATRRLDQDLSLWTELHMLVQRIQVLGPDIEKMCDQAAAEMPQVSSEHSSPVHESRPWSPDRSFKDLGAEFERATEAVKDASEEISLAAKATAGPWSIIRTAAGVGDVLDAGKVAVTAVRALGGVAIALGGVSLIVDIVTLVKTATDMKEGSRCELAEKYRKEADRLEAETDRIVEECRKVEKYVEDAKLALGWALKVQIVSGR
ncbi:uncharacterized protein LOC135500613 [Lineus longissimus]|uniref:uncharacterized protein LOC135500613 n=1 Tax=Lineus longissimus TaxID=88925 RepID=UPI002B4CB2A2